jgi:predicted CXXCH cytochrome family protein
MIALNRKTIIATALLSSMMVASTAMAGIANTKHNLSSTAGTDDNRANWTSATDEICVFCHTPHNSETTITAPLWNKTASGATYTTYSTANSGSIDGGVMPVGSVSIACLSCHDGTQAMDVMVNSPGSGTYGSSLADTKKGLTIIEGGSWTGSSNAAGKMIGFAMLGNDLTNDHPIGIQYAGGGITDSSMTMTDKDFKAPAKKTVNSTPVWWIDTDLNGLDGSTPVADGIRQKTDLPLYTRTYSTIEQPFVECASCHDPHTENTTFLRIDNTGSAVCLACHTK